MKKIWSIFGVSLGMLLCATGCVNQVYKPLPPRENLNVEAADMKIPMRWVYQLGKNVEKSPVVCSPDTTVFPYNVDIPEGSAAYGSRFQHILAVSPGEAYSQFFCRMNQPNADLAFWRNVIFRVLFETHGYTNIQERGFITREAFQAVEFTCDKVVEGQNYKYRLVILLVDDTIYFAELRGKEKAFNAAAQAFDDSVQNMDLSYWRICRNRSQASTFFAYDPVTVNVPDKCSGLYKPSPWFFCQIGICPYAQIFNSQSTIYGAALNLISLQQETVGGVSLSLFNGCRKHYGIQLGGFTTSAEENYGINISSLYTSARKNYGLSIGLITVSEEDSAGVQIGLLNFSKSPRHLPCFPFISLPLFSDLNR